MALLENSTFETGIGGWNLLNLPGPAAPQVIRNGTARSGNAFLRWSPNAPMSSVAIDFIVDEPKPPRSLCALAYVRVAPNPQPATSVSGIMKMWNLSLPGPQDANDTHFTVGSDWSILMCAIDLPLRPTTRIRLEFYYTAGVPLMDIDTVNVF